MPNRETTIELVGTAVTIVALGIVVRLEHRSLNYGVSSLWNRFAVRNHNLPDERQLKRRIPSKSWESNADEAA